ncbi:MAG: hypothetical protein OXH04_00265 [Acidobacteria bacterium]|nr:hypothetical protein [Acidobacteriota bacterium]
MTRRGAGPPALAPFLLNALLGALLLAAAAPTAAQAQELGSADFEPPRTPWGDPDFRGYYLPGPYQPLEAPAGDPWVPPEGSNRGQGAAFSRFFEPDPDDTGPGFLSSPMIVDPPDGKVPLQPWAAERRGEIMARQDELALLDPRVKCLPSALPRAHLPVGYNTYQVLQVPGYVVMLYEWNHLSRYISLDDDRPPLPPGIRLGMGDSRGGWEGDTLVVETTHFTTNTWPVGHGAPPEGAPASALTTGHGVFHSGDLHVTERFTMTDADTIRYRATIADPNVFTQPWTIEIDALRRAPEGHMLFEYACHEGNGRNLELMTGADVSTARVGVR